MRTNHASDLSCKHLARNPNLCIHFFRFQSPFVPSLRAMSSRFWSEIVWEGGVNIAPLSQQTSARFGVNVREDLVSYCEDTKH